MWEKCLEKTTYLQIEKTLVLNAPEIRSILKNYLHETKFSFGCYVVSLKMRRQRVPEDVSRIRWKYLIKGQSRYENNIKTVDEIRLYDYNMSRKSQNNVWDFYNQLSKKMLPVFLMWSEKLCMVSFWTLLHNFSNTLCRYILNMKFYKNFKTIA